MNRHNINQSTSASVLRTATLLVISGCVLSGCLRYVPSRDEFASKSGAKADVDKIGGEAEFAAYESQLKTRLDKLVSERAHLLSAAGNDAEFRVGPGDVLELDVYGFTDLKSEAEVGANGTISLPLVGQVAVAGRSITDVRADLTNAYGQYIRSPKIQLGMKSYQASRVSVIGEVSKPGAYPLRRAGQLLTDLLSEAGGRTEKASSRIILLPAPTRNSAARATVASLNPLAAGAGPQSQTGVEIDLDQLLGRANQSPLLVPLLPGDTIVVPEMGNFEVDGEVDKPGSFKLASRTSAMGAIAAAGGFTYSADVNKVEIIRDIGEDHKALVTLDLEEAALRGGKDVRLRDGDIVRVPSESGRFFRRQLVEALNSVFRGVGVTGRAN